MDLSNNTDESRAFYENSLVTPTLIDDQEDIFQCGKCKENFTSLREFLSHKNEHVSANENVDSQIMLKYDSVKTISLTQSSSQIWIWNSSEPSTGFQQKNFMDHEMNIEEQVTPSRNVSCFQQREVEKLVSEEEVLSEYSQQHQLCTETTDLTCSDCQRAFKKQCDFYLHLRTHTGEKPFQCLVCGRTFSHKSNLKKHKSTHRVWPNGLSKTLPQPEKGGLGYNCPFCQKYLLTYLNLKTHLKEHANQKLYKCIQSKCLAMFVDFDSLISHVNISHQVTEYHCHLCSLKLLSLDEISQHQKSHHPSMIKSNQPTKHTCIYCNVTFKKYDRLAHHLATASHVNNCSHCEKSFVSERALRRHLILHDDSRNIKCDICKLSFKTKSYLISHMATHSKSKNFICTICNVKFTRKDILMRHIKIHQPNKIKYCPFRLHVGCMMEFTRTDKLNQHVKTHTEKLVTKKKAKNKQPVDSKEHSTIEIIIVPMPAP